MADKPSWRFIITGIIICILSVTLFKVCQFGVNSYRSYTLDYFTYDRMEYVGNKVLCQPKDLAFMTPMMGIEECYIGYMFGKAISGESYVNYGDGHILIGTLHNGIPTKWCLDINESDKQIYLAYFNNGRKTGTGLLFDGEMTSVVTFDSDIVDHISDLGNQKYFVDNITFNINPEYISYSCDSTVIVYKHTSVYYEKMIDEKILFSTDYAPGESINVCEVDIATHQTLGKYSKDF